jgi:hypothetical protein
MSSCCCADWVSLLARDHAGRLAALARREGVSATDAASYYEAWALVIGGAVVLIAVLMSKLRRS